MQDAREKTPASGLRKDGGEAVKWSGTRSFQGAIRIDERAIARFSTIEMDAIMGIPPDNEKMKAGGK